MNRNKLLRLTCILLAIVSGCNLLSFAAAWLVADRFGGISFNVTKAATVGIIGGADGPTAVFVTAAGGPMWQLILWLTLFAIALLALRHLRKK